MDQLPAKREQTTEGLVVEWIPQQLLEEFNWVTTLPNNTREERYKVLALIDGESIRAADIIGSELFLWHYIIHPATFSIEETGETADGVRILLPQPDGAVISSTALGVIQSIARIQKAEGCSMPFDPPIKVVLKQVRGQGARRIYKLVRMVG